MKREKNKFIAAQGSLFIKLSSLCFLLFHLSSCSQSSVYERNITINDQLWFHRQVPEFEIHTIDTTQNFDIFVNLRHSSKYNYSNLALIIQEVSPTQEEKTYYIQLQLAEPDGRWKGIGTGNILSYQALFLKDYHFADTGIYTFRVKQNMNINPLPEILDVGIKVISGKVIAPI